MKKVNERNLQKLFASWMLHQLVPKWNRFMVAPFAANPPCGILKTTKFGIIPPEWRKEGENEEVFERVS